MLLMRSAMRRASFCGSACANQMMVPIPKSAAMIQPAIAPIPRGVNSSGIRVIPLGAPERSSPSLPAALPVAGIPLAWHRSFMDCGKLMRCWATSGATTNSAANPDSRCHSIWQWKNYEIIHISTYVIGERWKNLPRHQDYQLGIGWR